MEKLHTFIPLRTRPCQTHIWDGLIANKITLMQCHTYMHTVSARPANNPADHTATDNKITSTAVCKLCGHLLYTTTHACMTSRQTIDSLPPSRRHISVIRQCGPLLLLLERFAVIAAIQRLQSRRSMVLHCCQNRQCRTGPGRAWPLATTLAC
jgi:hypothetical protein